MEQSDEIYLNTFIERLLFLLHKELNKFQGEKAKTTIQDENIDETNEKQVLKFYMK